MNIVIDLRNGERILAVDGIQIGRYSVAIYGPGEGIRRILALVDVKGIYPTEATSEDEIL